MPQDTGREWLAYKGQRKTTISLFADFVAKLMNEVNQLQDYEFGRPVPKTSRPPVPTLRAQKPRVLLVQEVTTPAPVLETVFACVMGCVDPHSLNRCPLFLGAGVDGRWQVVKEKRRCTS